jgi:hypothetical protein
VYGELNAVEIGVEVTRRADGAWEPRRIRLDGRQVAITDILDEWPGADHRYFKARGDDGNLYILRFDDNRSAWELILFSTPTGEEMLR